MTTANKVSALIQTIKSDDSNANIVENKIGKYTFILFSKPERNVEVFMIWKGSREKPFRNLAYRANETGIAQRIKDVEYHEKTVTEEIEMEEAIKNTKASDKIKIGDIMYDSWGYSMTIVDFYQVVGFKGAKSIIVRQIADMTVSGDAGYSGTKSAVKEGFVDEKEYVLRLNKYGYFTWTLQGRSGSSAYEWNGKPKYFNSLD